MKTQVKQYTKYVILKGLQGYSGIENLICRTINSHHIYNEVQIFLINFFCWAIEVNIDLQS